MIEKREKNIVKKRMLKSIPLPNIKRIEKAKQELQHKKSYLRLLQLYTGYDEKGECGWRHVSTEMTRFVAYDIILLDSTPAEPQCRRLYISTIEKLTKNYKLCVRNEKQRRNTCNIVSLSLSLSISLHIYLYIKS